MSAGSALQCATLGKGVTGKVSLFPSNVSKLYVHICSKKVLKSLLGKAVLLQRLSYL